MDRKGLQSKLYSLLFGVVAAAVIGVPHPSLARRDAARIQKSMPIPGSNPQVCIGYNAKTNHWGEEFHFCPVGYAAYGVADAGGKRRGGATIPAVQVCCPLPASDILVRGEVLVREVCPEDHIATGSVLDFSRGENTTQYMRCSKINTARYQLGTPEASLYWGNGFAGWQGSRRIEKEQIPAGIRTAMGRQSKEKWGHEGCVGFPYGSLLTAKTGKNCGGFFFRELQFRGIAGDPAEGTPVTMFPECKDVTGVDHPKNVRCRNG